MRGLRESEPIDFDQADPEGVEGLLPASEIAIGVEQFVLEGEGQREALLCDIEALAISEIVAEQGAPAPEPHLHPDHVESFFVLEGEVGFVIGAEEVGARDGTWVQVPGRHTRTRSASRPVPRACSRCTRPPRASATSSARSTRPMTKPMRSSARGSTKSRRDEGARPARHTLPRSAGHLAGAPKPPQGCPAAIARSAAGS